MPRVHLPLLPALDALSKGLGQRIALARGRRNLSLTLFAERIGVSRNTCQRMEEGDANVSLGTYLRALRVLGLEKDVAALAGNDELGRKLQDAKLLRRPRTSGTSEPSS